MEVKVKVSDLQAFDPAEFLDNPESVAAYLNDIIEADDPALLASALGDVARAKGMTQVAEGAGITREALYKALRPDADPRFATISRVCRSLGLKFVVAPAEPAVLAQVPARSTRRRRQMTAA